MSSFGKLYYFTSITESFSHSQKPSTIIKKIGSYVKRVSGILGLTISGIASPSLCQAQPIPISSTREVTQVSQNPNKNNYRIDKEIGHISSDNNNYKNSMLIAQESEGRKKGASNLSRSSKNNSLQDFRITPDEFLKYAQEYIGIPYSWGGKNKNGLDCSGFVSALLSRNLHEKHGDTNAKISMDSHTLRANSTIIPRTLVEKGDLVFLPGHVMVAMGPLIGGKIRVIDASQDRGSVANRDIPENTKGLVVGISSFVVDSHNRIGSNKLNTSDIIRMHFTETLQLKKNPDTIKLKVHTGEDIHNSTRNNAMGLLFEQSLRNKIQRQ